MERRDASLLPSVEAIAPWAKACYGLDHDGGRIIGVCAERARGRILWTDVLPRDVPALKDQPRNVVCVGAVPATLALVRWVEAPYSSLRKALQVLPTLLDIELPFPLDQCVHSFPDACSTAKGTTRVLAVAARMRDVEKALAPFRLHGLDPALLDCEGLALWTQVAHEAPLAANGTPPLRIVLHLRQESTTLVLGRGRSFAACHALPGRDAPAIGRVLHAQIPSDPGPVEWHWTGVGAEDPAAVSALHTELGRDWPGPSLIHNSPAAFLARAVAQRALCPGPCRCNLRTGPLAHPAMARRAGRRETAAASLCIAASVMLAACGIAARIAAARNEARIDRETALLADRIAGFHVSARGSQAVSIARDAASERQRRMQPFLDAVERSPMAQLDELMRLGQALDLRFSRVDRTRTRLSLAGTAADWNSCDRLAAWIRQQFGAEPSLQRQDAQADSRIPFALSAGEPDA